MLIQRDCATQIPYSDSTEKQNKKYNTYIVYYNYKWVGFS